jgi:hypothetical protein
MTPTVCWRVRAGIGAVILALAGLPPGASPARAVAETTVSVRGSVTDETGAAVPAHVVRLLKSRAILSLRSMKTTDQNVEEIRATTDEHGLFELSFSLDPRFKYYYLRFYDLASFDKVRFRMPDDLEITRKARSGRPVQATVILKPQPDWPQVKALIDQFGPASHCGQILRSLGLPTRRTPEENGHELWTYERDGVAYLVDGAKVLETRHLAPTTAAAPAPGQDDQPTPAVRVEEP